MLIKIDGERYINSDHIVYIKPNHVGDNTYQIFLINKMQLKTSNAMVSYIAQLLDASDAFTEDQPPALSLESQLAEFLRNQSAGQTFEHICRQFSDRETVNLTAALRALTQSNIVKNLGDSDNPLYYHASNPIVAGPPSEF